MVTIYPQELQRCVVIIGNTIDMNKHKTLRIKAGLKIKKAAWLLGIKCDTLYKIESNQRKPGTMLKFKMAELYGCSIDNL